jgi:glycosyltransferase involved in cell wall biosynthesis
MVALTIGMATYNDFDGVYFTIQALRLYQDLTDTEILVVDNYGCEHTKSFVEGWAKGRYILAQDAVGTAAPRDLVFREGQGEAILCCDAHVFFVPGAIARLKRYYQDHPDTIDLLQGPLLYDDLGPTSLSTHFDPFWRDQMWGIWATDPRGLDPEGDPFDIPMQGLGAFSCRKAAWPGFNPAFRGFGGEEGYIHEKVRQAGGRTLCLPWFRWVHRFGRPKGVPYPLFVEDKLRNYVIGHAELGLDLTPIVEHFSTQLPPERVTAIAQEASRGQLVAPAPSLQPHPPPPPPPPSITRFGVTPGPVPFVDFTPAESFGNRGDLPLPLISCICATYNRPPDHQHLIEEAIESFLRQTYPNKELIVINDCPEQELICTAPAVRVVNLAERLPTLGGKLNAAIQLSHGDLIALWDDDDLNLPWRLSLSVARLGEADYFNPRAYWFLDGTGWHADHAVGYAHNASLFTRKAYDRVGGYPSISLGSDAAMDAALGRLEQVVDPHRGATPLTRAEWFYIYRWGVSPVHLSGRPQNDEFYQEIGTRKVQPGRFRLSPNWRRDYEGETRALLAAVA